MLHSPAKLRPLAALAAIALALSACTTAKGPPVPLATVDLNRIYGGWYILATIPNWFERGIVESYDHYSAGPGGTVHEDFYMRDGGFDKSRQHLVTNIEVLPGTGNADWRVKPIWPVSLPFQILYVDPQYRFVLFGEQDRSLGWIYARKQTISDADFQSLMDRFRDLGYDTSRFRKVVQFPDQIGQPGFLERRGPDRRGNEQPGGIPAAPHPGR